MGIARLVLLGLLALGCGPGAADEAAPLLPLHEVGPWPWTSSLVAYRDRLWLANSDRTRDCSCADLYSFDPAAGAIVYERHLFSQSVGRPIVHGGLLYWPYEDSRWNLGVAHVGVTDGERWRLLAIEYAQPLTHATAMASDGTTLWLATANPGLRLFASRDGGLSWTARAGTPPREGLRWVLRAAPFAGGLYGIVIDGLRGRSRWLARIDTGRPERVADLPAGADALEVIVHDGRLLALAEVAGSGELWASDGERSEPLGPGPPRGRLRDVASDAEGRLWALSLAPPGGLVWRRGDTGEWLLEARVEGGLPQELELVAGRPFVGGHADGGTGALWGAIGPGGEEPAPRAALPEPGGRGGNDWRALEARARAALAEPGAYQESARDARAALHALARSAAPPAAFER
ncbi:MAG TPA: PQQ-binding-like beta-propeller repeat protein, partial [Myxococcota bacterium]|nr:PQQ-binding-like beta-propeller repeat protein [Myxococcota bacterium]